MQRTNMSLSISSLITLFLVTLIGGCVAVGSTKHATSVVEFLYPDTKNPIVNPSIPELNLPLRVGIAFVPGEGGGTFGAGTRSSQFIFSEDKKINLMKEVAERFKSYSFVKDIQVIPSSDLTTGGSFANLDRIRTEHGEAAASCEV